ncbi:hypothetical protein R3P38DRAFT_3182393 [Favolaschia claudopus]|uniref:Uncharacterized protein n=1 Tax=Favolaschia claudopus TaxID=2862362 RepID=A0AAW0CGR6_9AGAR
MSHTNRLLFICLDVGHAFKRLGSSIEEDDMDESLIPLDGEETMIVDHDLHRALIQPLPASSQLVPVLDTSTILDLEHSRCNRVYLPWLSESENMDAKRSRRGVDKFVAEHDCRLFFDLFLASSKPSWAHIPSLMARVFLATDPEARGSRPFASSYNQEGRTSQSTTTSAVKSFFTRQSPAFISTD